MKIHLTDIVLFLAAAQSILLAVLIFQKYRRLFANRFLGLMLICYSIILVHLLFSELGFYESHPHLLAILLGFPFILTPLHLLYAKYLIYRPKRFQNADWVHLAPFILFELIAVPMFFIPNEKVARLLQELQQGRYPAEFIIFNWAITAQGLAYMAVTLILLNTYEQLIKQAFSAIENFRLRWLKVTTYMMIGGWILFAVENIFLLYGINLSNFDITSVLVAIYIYTFGYMGLLKSEVFTTHEFTEAIKDVPELGGSFTVRSDPEVQKYEKSGLSPETAKKYLVQLVDLMEKERPYLRNNLTLGQLAEMLSITPHNLSEVINTQLDQNFYDYVNRYRIEYVKKDLGDPSKQQLKILAIAFEAGFNSKTAFNAIFKEHTTLTPSEYRKREVVRR